MKKVTLFLAVLVGACTLTTAQNTVEIDANAEFFGYANVFETPANGGDFVFGDPWGVPDLKTVVDPSAGTLTLQPNFNTYGDNPTDPFWVDQTTGEGNKVFQGLTYIEDNSLVGSELTFVGGCVSKTIDAGYDVVAFIRVFDVNYTLLAEETADLVAGQTFAVNYTNVEPEDAVIQYGFSVKGINADPADEAILGSVVVGAESLGINDVAQVTVSTYPNPVANVLNVQAKTKIQEVSVYNILGQHVTTVTPGSNKVSVAMHSTAAGVYIANVTTETGTKSIKFIKK